MLSFWNTAQKKSRMKVLMLNYRLEGLSLSFLHKQFYNYIKIVNSALFKNIIVLIFQLMKID